MPAWSRSGKKFIGTLLLLIFVFAIFDFLLRPVMWNKRVTRESIRILQAAQTRAELEHAVGTLGIFFFFPDESWMAIRYLDSHSGGISSSAVARDSGGGWFHSRHHFCGLFAAYPGKLETQQVDDELTAMGHPPPKYSVMAGFEGIDALARSENLHAARISLKALKFVELQGF
jgi:hypothetical protein